MTKRILLCDDEIHILRAAEFKFKRAGYDVEIAGDGQEAWEAIERQSPTSSLPIARCRGWTALPWSSGSAAMRPRPICRS